MTTFSNQVPKEADYIIVGGGLTGCAIASRLSQWKPTLNVLLLEAGPDPSANPAIRTLMGGLGLLGSELDWAYKSTPQSNTGNRIHPLNAGRGLGGGSTINYGGWIRGDAADYDAWSAAVAGEGAAASARWSYAGMLPYFRRSERYFDPAADPALHGFNGPMHVASIAGTNPARHYPLRDAVRAAFEETGVQPADESHGRTIGIREFGENSSAKGERQPSYEAYPLDGVTVVTEATVHRVEFDAVANLKVGGVRLADGQLVRARREVILCAGALRTPQILMLSGIGPRKTLEKFNIFPLSDLEGVGGNLHDHYALNLAFRLRDPQRGLALGSPQWTDPSFFLGLPYDWVVGYSTPDNSGKDKFPPRVHTETFVVYVPPGIPGIPMDGTHVATSTLLLLPTSRGSVSISSASPTEAPLIDPNYYDTFQDRSAMIYAVQQTLKTLLGTQSLQGYIASESPPAVEGESFASLSARANDRLIDERIRKTGTQHHHSGGTAAMGSVVDGECRVKGVTGLRVGDASILPLPIGGHPQPTLYAVAEIVAALISGESKI
ncbi:MAG: hypothetical protein MMC23_008702 [Stictis urceolatum]|nr:hypothetical protein [Stictis urceolata]